MGSDFSSDATLALRRVHVDPAKQELVQNERHRAARVVAGGFARGADDCALLLEMLGLAPQDGLTTKDTAS